MKSHNVLRRFLSITTALPILTGLALSSAQAEWRFNPLDEAKIFTVIYVCESGEQVVVRYDNSNPATPTASLKYKSQTFDLYNVVTPSGARFATEQGLAPDMGLQWRTENDQATLSEMLMDHTAPDAVAIENCSVKPKY